MLQVARDQFCANGYEAIGLDHYALHGDSLAEAARAGTLHRNFQGYTTGGDLDLLGVGPTAISQFPGLFSQNHRDLKAYYQALGSGCLPTERGLVVDDPDLLERRSLIKQVMCQFQVDLPLHRYPQEWLDLQALARDGLVNLRESKGIGTASVTPEGRWLLRSIAARAEVHHKRRDAALVGNGVLDAEVA